MNRIAIRRHPSASKPMAAAVLVTVAVFVPVPARADDPGTAPETGAAGTAPESRTEPVPPLLPSPLPRAPSPEANPRPRAMGPVPDPFPDPVRYQAPHLRDSEHFTIDPVVDGVLTVGGAGFTGLLTLILGTGEIRPQAPGPSSKLLSIDRAAVTQTIDPNASSLSTVGLYAAYAYAVLDPIVSGVRDGRNALLVDAIMYAESIAITQAFTLATKIGVRRPRPIDYVNCSGSSSTGAGCDNTDLQLSFFSGHASTAGAISATATYLAFSRAPHTARPWITLLAGTALTTFVSYERVRSGEHFPTDVIMGSLAGAAIGVLVPHFHRRPHYHQQELEAPPILIGYAPTPHGGSSVNLQWRF